MLIEVLNPHFVIGFDLKYKQPKTTPCQVSRNAEDKEMAATVETVKEKRPAIGLSCKRKVVQAVLKTTGQLYICIPWKISNKKLMIHSNTFV